MMHLQRICAPYLHLDVLGLEELQHAMIHRLQGRRLFLIR
jgi:hypothetical protein